MILPIPPISLQPPSAKSPQISQHAQTLAGAMAVAQQVPARSSSVRADTRRAVPRIAGAEPSDPTQDQRFPQDPDPRAAPRGHLLDRSA